MGTRSTRSTDGIESELEELVKRLWGQNGRLAQLEQAKRRTTQFMVHDFKTHLGCIMEYSELLLKRAQGRWAPEEIDALTRIRRQGARMTAAVTDMLEFARLQEAGAPRKESVSAEEILRQVSEDLSLPDHFRNVELGPGHKACPPLWVDPRLTRRALSNLVANALKHNPVGTQVVIDAQPSAENRREVLFMCRDDGRGIPPDKVPTIFDEFNGGSEESTGDSTGLGLAFCRAAVEAHGGRIWCESTVGKGTCFFFTVPTSEEAAEHSLVGSADERRVP